MEDKIKILAFGNPLLDNVVQLPSDDLLHKHNLQKDGQKEITGNEIQQIIEDVTKLQCRIIRSPGGCAQNTLRVMQWLLDRKCEARIVGAVGSDDNAAILRDLLTKDGVQTNYIVQTSHPTGTTVALVNGANRSLVAHLGAAEIISVADIQRNPQIQNCITNARLVYIEGFFLSNRDKVVEFTLNQYQKLKNNSKLAFNLSGDYLCKQYPDTVILLAKAANLLFGNRREFETLCPIFKVETIHQLFPYLDQGDNKVIVVTDGPNAIHCWHGGKVEEIGVPQVSAEIVDTTGAGDAFVGGFLSGVLQGLTPLECAGLGCYAAHEIIKTMGCTLPDYPPKMQLKN